MLPIIVLLLCESINLSHSIFHDRSRLGCKNPKGKNGDTYINGCNEYKCIVSKWKNVGDVCRDSDQSISSKLLNSPCPGCPPNLPYCSGICFLGYKCSGICLPTDLPYPRGCALQAGDLTENECKTDCQEDGSDSCNSCIGDNIPSHCQSLPTFGCFSCTGSIIGAYKKCSGSPNILMCIKEKVSSSCISCICTLACHLFGPGSTICKICTGLNEDPSAVEFYHSGGAVTGPGGSGGSGTASTTPSTPSRPCPTGWLPSTDGKCFIAITNPPALWTQARVTFCKNLGNADPHLGTALAGTGRLAIVDTPAKLSAVGAVISNGLQTSCWIAGQYPAGQNTGIFDWVTPTDKKIPITVEMAQIGWLPGYPKSPMASDCMTSDYNGLWQNTACKPTDKMCYVCETDSI